MAREDEKRRVAEAVFAVTGEKLPQDDPLVVAALFYADTLRSAGAEAAAAIRSAAAEQSEVAKASTGQHPSLEEVILLLRRAAAERSTLVDDLDKRIQRSLHKVVQQRPAGAPLRRSAMEVVATLAAGVVLLFCVEFVWFDFSLDWANDVRTGRAFNRSVPTLAPDLRKRLIEHIEKHG